MKVVDDPSVSGRNEEMNSLLAALSGLLKGDASVRLPLHWSVAVTTNGIGALSGPCAAGTVMSSGQVICGGSVSRTCTTRMVSTSCCCKSKPS